MELQAKGASANLATITSLRAIAKWTSAVDFDIAALWEKKCGEKGIVNFQHKGDLNAFPFMMLDKDMGVGGAGGDNSETIIIAKLEEMKLVHLLVTNYDAINGKAAKDGNPAIEPGSPGNFGGSDIKITLESDDTNEVNDVALADDDGNVVLLATIDNSGMIPKIINRSSTAVLKGFPGNTDAFFALAEG